MILRLALVPLLAVVTPSGVRGAQEILDLREAYDVLAYDIALAVDPAAETIEGTVTVTARVVADELGELRLDIGPLLEVEEVLAGGAPLEHRREDDALVCRLPAPAARGADAVLTVAYSGRPRAEDSFTGFHWAETADGRPWINTSCQGPGAHSWWPCKSSFYHPEDKPERVSMAITVPGDLYAVSNGRLEGVDEGGDGRKTFRWRHDYPLETYSVTLNVAPYVVVESELALPGIDGPVPFVYYVLPESEEKARLQFAEVPRLLEVYSEAFGPFPFAKSKFGLVETNFWGMEHSTAVAYGSSFPAWCEANGVEDPYARRHRWFDYILVHEVAHEWWGNAVSADDWGDFWIHEGFGTYAEGVYVEKTQGRERADAFFRDQARSVGKHSRLYRGEGTDSSEAYDGVIYSKGACVLDTLRHYVADDEAWWRALREFNLRFRYKNAGTGEFRAVLEDVTGKDWGAFFEQWVHGEGWPMLSGSVFASDGAIRVRVRNAGSGATGFDVPLDLAWLEGGEPRAERVWVPAGGLERSIACDAPVTELRVEHLDRVLGDHSVDVR